jgi:hypothetical protein
MPRDISQQGWNAVARAILGFQEKSPLELEDYLRAVVALEVDRPEWSFLRQEKLWASRNMSQAAVAAEFSYIGISNPLDSGSLVVVEFHFSDAPAATLATQLFNGIRGAAFNATVLTEVPVNGMRDARFHRSEASQGVDAARELTGSMSAAELAAISPAAIGLLRHPGAGIEVRTTPVQWVVILQPGTYVIGEGSVVNTAQSGWFSGRTRPLQQGTRA